MIGSILRRGIKRAKCRPSDVEQTTYCVVGPLVLTMLWQHSLGPRTERKLDPRQISRTRLALSFHGLFAPDNSGPRRLT